MNTVESHTIKVIIGLGNPGKTYENTRHNIGFKILDTLQSEHVGAGWRIQGEMEMAHISINGHNVLLIKPQTFMNNSGNVVPYLRKKGIKLEEILVVHDDLEQPFGKITFKTGGSAKGHNGLRSFIAVIGEDFSRLRFGIGKPVTEEVADYVLSDFSCPKQELEDLINESVRLIDDLYKDTK
jgi:PTH1 family peptidyl-tRNA hydrolase